MTMKTLLSTYALLLFFTEGYSRKNGLRSQKGVNENPNPVYSRHTQRLPVNESQTESNEVQTFQESYKKDDEVFLRIKSDMISRNLTSGEEAHFKCRVEGKPMENIRYTWYHNDKKIVSNYRFRITAKPWGSKLQIKSLFTLDTGTYRCEASNGLRRVHTTALLSVSFKRPPALNKDEEKIFMPRGSCEVYHGNVCKEYLKGSGVYVDVFEDQPKMEEAIKIAIAVTNSLSDECQRLALPAFCFYIFPPCQVEHNGDTQRSERLCREDCEILKKDICKIEHLSHAFMKNLSKAADCSFLSSRSQSTCKRLTMINARYSVNSDVDCYRARGSDYAGKAHISETGVVCKSWPSHVAKKNPAVLEGHNFCRNPNGEMERPWCYIDDEGLDRRLCNISSCDARTDTVKRIALIASCLCGVAIATGLIAYFLRRRNLKRRQNLRFTFKHNLKKPLVFLQNTIPELKPSSVCFITEIGAGKYGIIYKGKIVGDPQFEQRDTFAIKTLKENFVLSEMEEFKHEYDVLAKLNHKNITSLQGVVMQANLHCMLFDYTNQVDLHEYLLLNSPPSVCSKSANTFSTSSTSTAIDSIDFMDMAIQIASGMEYLSNKNFIHRDLAARNILVCGNMDLKISNLGVIRDSYLSSYYENEHGNMMPIRWMAPESIHSWKFSHKSTAWSFGVLLWEMFNYGSQPYCGYSNQEVLEMISHGQLLDCPDQCPAKMYSLMQECWGTLIKQRPTFYELRNRLSSWMEMGEVTIIKSVHSTGIRNPYRTLSPPPEYKSSSSHEISQQFTSARKQRFDTMRMNQHQVDNGHLDRRFSRERNCFETYDSRSIPSV